MEWQNLAEFLINNGVAVLVVVYFLWKDSRLTKENTDILNQVKSLLEIMVKKEKLNEEV